MISRFVSLFCALFALALLNACATTLEATTDFDQQFDFSPVRKLAILTRPCAVSLSARGSRW